jgi:serine/threonine protein phosphatase 1
MEGCRLIFIGDLGGHFTALIRLLEKAKWDGQEEVFLLGDLNDRGPESRSCIEFAMSTPNICTLASNHGDMMTDWYRTQTDRDFKPKYEGLFLINGGRQTLDSYGVDPSATELDWARAIPKEHIKFLESLPLLVERENVILSHAPIPENCTIEEALQIPRYAKDSLLWNRSEPCQNGHENRLQIFGHNSHFGLRFWGSWAVCLDSSRQQVLTAIRWPSKTIYQQYFG